MAILLTLLSVSGCLDARSIAVCATAKHKGISEYDRQNEASTPSHGIMKLELKTTKHNEAISRKLWQHQQTTKQKQKTNKDKIIKRTF